MKNWLFLNAFTLDFAFLVSLRKEKRENFPSVQFEKSIERERERERDAHLKWKTMLGLRKRESSRDYREINNNSWSSRRDRYVGIVRTYRSIIYCSSGL